ncbi:MAG TPA: NAD-dependent epimerase/dehydratase family protein [Devosia sp.]
MDKRVIILGINGHVGHHVAKAFVAAGWEVHGFGRSNKHPVAGVRFVKGDANDVASMREAIGDIGVVVNALNLPYDQWDKGRKVAQTERVIAAMGTSGKTLLFPGNIYNYAASDRIVTPDLPQRPETPRGAIRVEVEELYRAAARRGDIQAIILRAGDFYGPESQGDWFDLVMMTEARKGKVQLMGVKGVGHAWAYLPDLGRAFEKLARHRSQLGGFETFHFAGHFVTPKEMGTAIAAVRPVKVSMFPRWIINAMGLVNPVMREVGKMAYLWEHPMELRDSRLDDILGPDFATPFGEAVAATVTPFFAAERAAA